MPITSLLYSYWIIIQWIRQLVTIYGLLLKTSKFLIYFRRNEKTYRYRRNNVNNIWLILVYFLMCTFYCQISISDECRVYVCAFITLNKYCIVLPINIWSPFLQRLFERVRSFRQLNQATAEISYYIYITILLYLKY